MPNSKKNKSASVDPSASKKKSFASAPSAPRFVNPWADAHLVRYFGSVRARFGNLRVLQIATYKETRRDFHIDDIFVRPALSAKYISLAEAESTPSFGADLLAELQEHQRIVILGDPGSGKSTIVNWIAWSLASTEDHRPLNLAFKDYIPLPIILREAQVPEFEESTLPSLDSIFSVFLSQRFAEPLRDQLPLLHDLFERGQTFFLFDGIDELSGSKREWLRHAWIRLVLDGHKHPAPAILTSRIVGYDCSGIENAELLHESNNKVEFLETEKNRRKKGEKNNLFVADVSTNFIREELAIALLHQKPPVRRYAAPFDQSRIRDYSRNWYRLRDRREAEATAHAFLTALEENPHLRELRHSPLLLTFMAIVYNVRRRLPDGRVLVYKEIVQAFLETIPLEKKLPVEFSPDTVREALALLAWEAQTLRDISEDTDDKADRGILLPESIVRESMRQGLSQSMGTSAGDTVVEALIDYCKNRTGLLVPRGVPQGKHEEHYAFALLSFQEYLASQHLLLQLSNEWSRRQSRREGFTRVDLNRLAGRENWRETFILLFESMSEQVGALNPAAFAGYLFDSRMANQSRGFSLVDWYDEPEGAKLPKLSAARTRDDYQVFGPARRRLQLLVSLLADTRITFPPTLREHLLRFIILQLPVAEPVLPHRDAQFRYLSRVAPLASTVLSSPLLRDIFFSALCDQSPIELNLTGTQISDLLPLSNLRSLESLDLSGTPVSDVTPLAKLLSLQSLALKGTKVSEVSPLSKMSALQSLDLGGTSVADFSPLSKLSALQYLDASGTKIIDLAPLAKLSSLQILILSATSATDLSPLSKLTALQTLRLNESPVSDITPLAKISSLNSIFLLGTQVADLTPLAQLRGLEFIDLDTSQVADLSPLANLSSLQSLDIRNTRITDLSPLANLSSIQFLYLGESQVTDISPLSTLSSLRNLFLPNTQIADLSPLFGLKDLRFLALQGTLASEDKSQISALRKKLPGCQIMT